MDPGASVVLTHGLVVRPFSTAFFASSAAPIITEGFEVFVLNRGTSSTRPLPEGVQALVGDLADRTSFAAAIREVHAGKRHIDRELAAATIAAGESPLTQRETEVLGLAGQGGSVDDIAAAAHLAPGTTRNYLSSAMSKVGAQNRFEAHMRARELGWV